MRAGTRGFMAPEVHCLSPPLPNLPTCYLHPLRSSTVLLINYFRHIFLTCSYLAFPFIPTIFSSHSLSHSFSVSIPLSPLTVQVESGGSAVFASDMYSFGMLLLFMHYPTQAGNFVPGSSKVPQSCENELADLIDRLTSVIMSIDFLMFTV